MVEVKLPFRYTFLEKSCSFLKSFAFNLLMNLIDQWSIQEIQNYGRCTASFSLYNTCYMNSERSQQNLKVDFFCFMKMLILDNVGCWLLTRSAPPDVDFYTSKLMLNVDERLSKSKTKLRSQGSQRFQHIESVHSSEVYNSIGFTLKF